MIWKFIHWKWNKISSVRTPQNGPLGCFYCTRRKIFVGKCENVHFQRKKKNYLISNKRIEVSSHTKQTLMVSRIPLRQWLISVTRPLPFPFMVMQSLTYLQPIHTNWTNFLCFMQIKRIESAYVKPCLKHSKYHFFNHIMVFHVNYHHFNSNIQMNCYQSWNRIENIVIGRYHWIDLNHIMEPTIYSKM